jgi:ABC-type nickel/cobalt efflux system permease component RcnA
MDHHEQHHQHHQKEREEHKKHEKEREQAHERQEARDPGSLHPAWYVVLFLAVGVVLMGGVLLVWMLAF